MGKRGESNQESGSQNESFYTPQGIHESYARIEKEIEKWRLTAQRIEPEGIVSGAVRRLRGGAQEERFIEKEKSPPRLISLADTSGPIHFEFTEVEGGGTLMKATYNASLKGRIAKLKSELPLKVPRIPVGLNCPSCGKPVLREFNLCPYCGAKLDA